MRGKSYEGEMSLCGQYVADRDVRKSKRHPL